MNAYARGIPVQPQANESAGMVPMPPMLPLKRAIKVTFVCMNASHSETQTKK